MIKYTYRVLSQFEGGQPSNLRPSATVAPSLQQPYLVSPHVSKVGQSKSNGPAAALKSSGQQPNVVFEQSTNGAGLHRRSPKMAWSSSLVSSKKRKLECVKNGKKKCQKINLLWKSAIFHSIKLFDVEGAEKFLNVI